MLRWTATERPFNVAVPGSADGGVINPDSAHEQEVLSYDNYPEAAVSLAPDTAARTRGFLTALVHACRTG